ncbi:MAG: hypothetical protein GF350_14365 [Chitinivibrionales bacterium]|nr:hypothetical protein [Chitinivibrionales bacterium]
MIKKSTVIIFLIAIIPSFAATRGYDRTGLGFQIGLVLPDDPWPVDVGFSAGGHADIGFGIGIAGKLHYYPSINVWFGGDEASGLDFFALEVDLNVFDFRYYPPIPEKIPVRPFAGFAPMIAVEVLKQEYYDWIYPSGEPQYRSIEDDTDADPEAGFNLYAGADFIIANNFLLFSEIRGKFGDWDIFKFSGGMTFILW